MFFRVDLRNLEEVAEFGYGIATKNPQIDIIINNAGILSPPEFTKTLNGHELTYQVNFLSHLLLNQIIINEKPDNRKLTIVPVVSPSLRWGKIHSSEDRISEKYNRFNSYASSKLYLAVMGSYYSEYYKDKGIRSFSFNPGVFSSGIYRSQEKWFHYAYRFGAPFMRSPSKVVSGLLNLLEADHFTDGKVYNHRGKINRFPELDPEKTDRFREEFTQEISPFIR